MPPKANDAKKPWTGGKIPKDLLPPSLGVPRDPQPPEVVVVKPLIRVPSIVSLKVFPPWPTEAELAVPVVAIS
jgi:hypothetical protein